MKPRKQHLVGLYRMYSADGVLLYIGQSGAPARRIEQHAACRDWPYVVARIDVEWHPTRETAVLAEAAAIAAECPKYNIAHQPRVQPRKWPAPRGGNVVLAWMEANGVTEAQMCDITEIPMSKLQRLLRNELHATGRIPYALQEATGGAVRSSVFWRSAANKADAA